MRLDDTIAAVATPLLASGLGVIRVSGSKSIPIVSSLFKGSSLKKTDSHKFVLGWIQDKDTLIDKVLIVAMHAPNSYTTEDIVEIQCHGSPVVLRKILDLVLKKGARLAEPGEFTQRAFFNGRIDLTQAEAVSDLIHANSNFGAKIAAEQLNGKLYHAIDSVKEQVISIFSMVEASIEFPEETQEFVQREDCLKRLNLACADLEKLITNSEFGLQMREGFTLTFIGKPNVGKSSLFNILLKKQRAIVTDIPGTTRDSIEELMQIKGLPFRIIDTAGIRKSKSRIESEGIKRTQIARKKADVVLLILDASKDLNKEDSILIDEIEKKRTIVVINKKDLISTKLPKWYEKISDFEYILISAKTGEGCKELETLLFEKVNRDNILKKQDEIWITNLRQQQAAKKALESLYLARKFLEQLSGEEFAAVDLKSSLNSLGEIVGETTSDDLLGRIFSEFCIGK